MDQPYGMIACYKRSSEPTNVVKEERKAVAKDGSIQENLNFPEDRKPG